ncbi:MAG: putative transrane protein [Rhizobium sp.]|nr:putative transrane protein [Rhizobium sp.]
MTRSYYVLTAPASTDADHDTKFIRDGFSWLAFLLPLPWLLAKRLWLVALLAVLVYLVTIFIAEQYRLDALPVAFSFVLGLWTALEGGHAQARSLERKGWQIERVIAADRLSDAEEIYFAGKTATARAEPERPLPPLPARKAIASSDAVALGLIGPAGGR